MKWTEEAEAAVKKVPFFVRKRVRARVEKEAGEAGASVITLAEVRSTQARYLKSMASEIKGFQVDTCFGASGCPNRAHSVDGLMVQAEKHLARADLIGFLKEKVRGQLKFHHEFRVSFADCPNACSQPQIKDVGVIGACLPAVTEEACSGCGACEKTCREGAVRVEEERGPVIDKQHCLACGRCMDVCPTGTLVRGESGFRILLGGKLGRHPRLARELPCRFDADGVLAVLDACIALYKKRSTHGQRFAELFTEEDFRAFSRRFCKSDDALA